MIANTSTILASKAEFREMRPFLETLPWQRGSSLASLNRRIEDAIPFQWHHHPEYELTLTLNSCGQRFIGDHVGNYAGGDLVLVGPNLPHTWVSREKIDPNAPHIALVIWFDPEWGNRVTDCFVEFGKIRGLLDRAGRGLEFSQKAALDVRAEIEGFFDLPAADQLLSLMKILDRLSQDGTATALASVPVHQEGLHQSRERIDRVLRHIHSNYAQTITIEDLAELAALSESGLHRLFRKHTQGTVSQYLMALRIGDACARLSATNQPISHIAATAGYGALANFNRQFKALKGMTPRQYRAHFPGSPV